MLPNDALAAAVIGGLLTGAATLLGALLIRWLDIGRENRKLGMNASFEKPRRCCMAKVWIRILGSSA